MKPKILYAQCLNPDSSRPRFAVYQLVKGELEVLWTPGENGPGENRMLLPGQVYYPKGDKFPRFHFRPEIGASSFYRRLAVDLADYFLCPIDLYSLNGWQVLPAARVCHECRVCLKPVVGKTHHKQCEKHAKRVGVKL